MTWSDFWSDSWGGAQEVPLRARPDWRTGHRTEALYFRLFKTDGTDLGTLDGVESCTLDGSIFADVRWTGRLSWSGTTAIPWRDVLVQPWYQVQGGGAWPLGMFYCRSPKTTRTDTTPLAADVTLYDATLRLGADWTSQPAPVSIPAGAGIASTVTTRLQAAGISKYAITPTSKTLSAPLVYETGDSEAKILNGLLAAAGYWSVHADPYGVILGEPYVDPSTRVPSWEFPEGGDLSVAGEEWDLEADDFQVWNRLSGITRAVDPAVPITYTANLDTLAPWSPHTQAKRGMVITGATMRDVDAADLPALKAIVDRALLDQASVAERITITHPWLDKVQLGDVVTWWADGEARRYAIEKQSLSLELGMLVTSVGRRVA